MGKWFIFFCWWIYCVANFSALGGTSSGSIAPGNADKFKDGFNSDYYGLWRNGIVTNIKDPNYIDNKRITDPKRDNNRVIFKKILWKKEYLTILMVRFKTLFG
jgi:hypothetical protein